MSDPEPPAIRSRRVALLEKSVAERIAAGEVIERPASVVKELVENSLDAGATQVWVEVREGGQSLLKITDNGCGMSREDAVLALSRFATSKIQAWEDMDSLHTLGFRGEALASVSAVSRLEMITREHDADHGTRIIAQGAEPPRVDDAGCPPGTTAIVTRLFYNTPARRKFLKSSSGELARIVDILGRLALCRTDVHFRLCSASHETGEMRDVFNFPSQMGLADRLARLWHLPGRDGLAVVEREEGRLRICGVVGVPPVMAPNRTRQAFFVNGRSVGHPALSQALTQGFGALLPERRFPLAVLFIDLPPDEIDVNIHPTKAEVRFLHQNTLFRLVRDAVAQALGGRSPEPQDGAEAVSRHVFGQSLPREMDPESRGEPTTAEGPPQLEPRWGSHGSGQAHRGSSPPLGPSGTWRSRPTPTQVERAMDLVEPLLPLVHDDVPDDPEGAPRRPANGTDIVEADSVNAGEAGSPGPSRAPTWRILAQLDRTYIVSSRGEELWLVDQHAAHERINYERLGSTFGARREVASQPLLFPQMLELAPDEAQALHDLLPVFEALGYELEPFGGDSFVVRAVPEGLKRLSRPEVLRRIVAEVVADDVASEPDRLREKVRASTACRSSVMAGETLSPEEMLSLLTQLEHVPNASHCPHGRPTWIRLSPGDLARLFGRT